MISINHAQLRAFHAVASEGGFTRGAAALHVTQPTLSGQVKALEATYGVRLFDRRGRRVEPTELGRALLALTRRLFSLEAEADEMLAAARGLRRGHLRIGADAPYSVMPLIALFGRRYPGIRLSIAAGNSETLLHRLVEHQVDIAVVANVAGDPRFLARPLRRDRLVAFVERGHAWARRANVGLRDFAGERVILREQGSTTRRVFETALARAGIELTDTLEIASREAVAEAVAAGLGVGVVSEMEVGADSRLVSLPIDAADLRSNEYVVCLVDRQALRLVRAFLDIVGTAEV
jgi:aminoethylphosphonate catabolism LysR family transcriptional regulator